MTAAELADVGAVDDDDDQEDAGAHDFDGPAQARKIAGYLIVAGVLIAAGCIAFIVWEQWQANRAALEGNVAPINGTASHPAPHPNPPDQPGGTESQEASEALEGD